MKIIFTFLTLLCSFTAIANDKNNDINQLIISFVECDAQFFSDISSYKEELSSYTPVNDLNPQLAYIPVADRSKNGYNYHIFSKPIHYKSLLLTGYYDSALPLGKFGDYYFWGFIVDNSLDEIKSSLDFLSWSEMEKDSLYTANPKIRFSDDGLDIWHEKTNIIAGVKTMPALGTTEKLLLLEKSPEMTLLVCSVQGFFPPELLQTIRPDITLSHLVK
ncbi:hypothetical protein GCM10023211_16360 [Orbus sasakiae]|uniref:Uncharacterized protein n=1 Tax=Orbus sasakiae TaxID=1078475 RepID=A0ABP9N7F9_9GAMM